MTVAVGEVVPLTVTRVEPYGLWGTYRELAGSVHVSDYTESPPLPEDRIPSVGAIVRVRVFHVAPGTRVRYAFGEVVCDFAASMVLTPSAPKYG